MRTLRHSSFLLVIFTLISLAEQPQVAAQSAIGPAPSRNQQAVTGPRATMNGAIAAGATATVILQPVAPKTLPPSSYPMGSVIMNQTLFLSSVPARVWIEAQVTGWAPETLKTFQVRIDATDVDEDGRGYRGDRATCQGAPMVGAGDLFPAIQPCMVNSDCRSTISGISTSCGFGEPSPCSVRPSYFPPGGKVCEFGFLDGCDPQHFSGGFPTFSIFEINNINSRVGWTFNPGEFATDFNPSYSGTFVLDVPANAKGTYVIDVVEAESFMQNQNSPPNNNIPIAVLNLAVIDTPCGSCCTNPASQLMCTDGLNEAECDALPTTDARNYRPGITCADTDCCDCDSNMDCNDNDACTNDACQDSCYCTHTPIAGWNQATECCHPMNGMQAPIPQSTSCRTGGCSLGGSSGTPTLTNLPDLTSCASLDPCYSGGECNAGQCVGEQYAGSDCPKARFISFDIGTGATPSAFRVRLTSLHHPDPPYTGGPAADFGAFEGLYRWVGEPATYIESNANPVPVYAAFVDCSPHFQDWSTIDLLHVSGAEIVPSSIYEVQSIAQGLDINVESNYSASITIATARWADVIIPYSPPNTTAQPNAGDHAALVEKFRSGSSAMSKPRALLVGMDAAGIPSLALDVSFAEISAAVDAFKGRPYPFTGPAPCP